MKKLKWTRENTLKGAVPNKPGLYKFYNKNGKLIYVGHAKRLRHRVQSYRQKDCPVEHNEKWWRNRIQSYSYEVMPRSKAMAKEKKIKKNGKYNFL